MKMARIFIPVLAVGFVWSIPFAASPAFAQTDAQATENVIIVAPGLTQRPVPESGSGLLAGRLAPRPETVSLTLAVSYSDLNLSRAMDVAELESRVRNTAHALCRELVRDFASASIRINTTYPSRDCVRNATYGGMRNVRFIRAAQAHR